MAAVVVLLALAALAGLPMDVAAARLGLTPGPEPGSTMPLLALHLQAAAFAVALLLGAMCYARWRLVGDAALVWLAVAAVLHGLLAFGLGAMLSLRLQLPIRPDVGFEPLTALHLAAQVVVIGLVVIALRSPAVDSRLRLGWLVAGAVAATGALAWLLNALPVTPWLLGAPGPQTTWWAASFALLWLALMVWAVRAGVARPHPVLPWFALLFLALGVVQLAVAVPPPGGSERTAAPLLVLAGLVAAGVGAARGLTDVFSSQRGQLLASVAAERAAAARARSANATQAERAHEASNALVAIEAAVYTLQAHQEQLAPHERGELSAAVCAEITRLQHLVSPDNGGGAPGRFRVAEALASVVTCARSQGTELSLHVPADLVAIGQPAATSQVLLNLLENVRRHARGRAHITAELDGEVVVVSVGDDGPGIPAADRARLFERGHRATTATTPGSGLGLYVSARLMRDQGGALHVEERPGGGACFVLRLPGFRDLPLDGSADKPLDQREQHAERVGHREVTTLALAGDHEAAPGRVELDDGVGDDVVG